MTPPSSAADPVYWAGATWHTTMAGEFYAFSAVMAENALFELGRAGHKQAQNLRNIDRPMEALAFAGTPSSLTTT